MPSLIHAVGDSHACFFAGQDGLQPVWPRRGIRNLHGVRAWHLGPYLAHSFANERHEVRRKFRQIARGFASSDRVLLCFGEIDCRCHVVRRAKQDGRAVGTTAADVARRYAEAAARVRDRIGLEVGLWAPVPTTPARMVGGAYPTQGSRRDRELATRGFGTELSRRGAALGLTVLSAHDELISRGGARNEAMFADDVHLGQAALPLVRELLVRAGWIVSGSRALSHAREERVAGPGAGGAATDLSAAARMALIDRAALECAAMGARRVALLGAGLHTRRVTLKPFTRRGLSVVAILDDRLGRGRLLGVPVLPLERMPATVEAVIPSSDAHEPALLARAHAVFGQSGVRIVPVYTRTTAA